MAFSGCMGHSASTHNLYAVERRKEVWARRRAPLLPSGEGANRPQAAESAGAQHPASFVPDSEAFISYIGNGILVPELKDESEASKDEQADSSSGNNVGDGALFVIGLHGSGDAILSCHKALDMLCQELYEVERRRGWFGF